MKRDARSHKLEIVAGGMMTVAEAAKFSGFSTWSIYQAMKSGALPYAQYGEKRVIPRASLHDFLADRLILK